MISVIVCTYNRCESLRDTLQALKAQAVRESVTLEILIADNHSTDRTRTVVEQEAKGSPWPVHYLFEPRQGKSFALNTAIARARSTLLLFLDDDTIPEPSWAQALIDACEQQGADCAGGKILPLAEGEAPSWFSSPLLRRNIELLLCMLDHGDQPIVATEPNGNFLFGANLAIRRAVCEEIGLFRIDLGPQGHTLLRGEDTEMLVRIFKAGKRVVYTPHAIVHHKIPAQRLRLSYLRRRKFHGSRSLTLSISPRPYVAPWLIRECLMNGFQAVWAYLRGAREHGIQRELLFWAQLGQLVGAIQHQGHDHVAAA